ncbi:MAG: tRNA adenosine(34) deaminase TadA [Christensenellaceae bacterium]
MTKDEKYMSLALKEAVKAEKRGEVPVGCVIVKDDKVVARAFNTRATDKIAVNHAEIKAIIKACKKEGDWRLSGATLYVTLEPCAMCAGAILNARISRVVFGAYEKKGGAVVSNLQVLANGGLNWRTEYTGGVLEAECSGMLTEFFKKRR